MGKIAHFKETSVLKTHNQISFRIPMQTLNKINLFSHLIRRHKKPLQPRYTVQIATSNAIPTPVLCAALRGEGESAHLLLSHGNFLKPTFEPVVRKSDSSKHLSLEVMSQFQYNIIYVELWHNYQSII